MPQLSWIGYLSTVGVYGDHNGNWVGEDVACVPVSGRSKERLEAEAAWMEIGERLGVPAACCGFPASTVPGATPSAIWRAARRGG
jgi:hypothetical protein